MKIILYILVLTTLVFGTDTLMVSNYESSDLNNIKGINTSQETDIVAVIISQYYISFRGDDNSNDAKSYQLSNYELDGLDATFMLDETIYGYYFFNEKLIIVDVQNDKIEVYIF